MPKSAKPLLLASATKPANGRSTTWQRNAIAVYSAYSRCGQANSEVRLQGPLRLVSSLNTFVERVTLERDLLRTFGFTDDFAERAKASLEKHKPVFKGSQEHHRPSARGPHSPLPDTASSAGEPPGCVKRPMPVAKQTRFPDLRAFCLIPPSYRTLSIIR